MLNPDNADKCDFCGDLRGMHSKYGGCLGRELPYSTSCGRNCKKFSEPSNVNASVDTYPSNSWR